MHIRNENADFSDCVFQYNSADYAGGGLFLDDGNANRPTVSLSGLTAEHNTTVEEGGGLYITDLGPSVVESSVVRNNSATLEGGLWTSNAFVVVDGVVLRENYAEDDGGAVNVRGGFSSIDGELVLRDVKIAENKTDVSGQCPHATRPRREQIRCPPGPRALRCPSLPSCCRRLSRSRTVDA